VVSRVFLLSTGLALAVLATLVFNQPEHTADALQEKIFFGVDADPASNTATSLGNIDTCVSVQTGQTFAVDVFIENIVELAGWNATIYFDPAVVWLTDADVELMMAAAEQASIIDLSGDTPNDTGALPLAAVDFGTGRGASGAGVLARLTVEAVGPGVSELRLDDIALFNVDREAQEATGPDAIYRGAVSNAVVAVDEPCPEGTAVSTPQVSPTTNVTPGAATVTPTTTRTAASPTPGTPAPTATSTAGPSVTSGTEAEGDDGFPWAVVGGVVGGVAAVVVLGLVLGWRFRRAR
jgi:hypothetical protein